MGRFTPPSGGSLFNQFGIAPSFVSPLGRDEAFFVNPETGQRQLITASVLRNIDPRLITNLPTVGQFGPLAGSPVSQGQVSDILGQVREPGSFTKFSAPIVEPTTGTLLPAPFAIASQLNKLRLTNPSLFNMLLSAYESAGVSATSVLGTIQQALPFGQARTNIGLN